LCDYIPGDFYNYLTVTRMENVENMGKKDIFTPTYGTG
jgi:hypothetical protein